ncbi:type II toxin-antitoxin system VapC family toxin [Serinicoccus kebangsaanensis]|uniref:type II toxin-antitoxin system VapC family toxin n=1 Tax=Serinicoccus kebangsaanensis TaxID=2602069 RepID=UPI00124DA6FD|nr:type II toxin-antitoxin system VapC family toxin [Serinicoccus kebangsaanensis]
MIVLDASAAVDLLLRRGAVGSIEDLVRAQQVATTELLVAEVLQVLRRFAARGELTEARAAEAVDDLLDLVLHFYPVTPLARRMWALRGAVSAYDAAYVALATGLDATLVTTDRRLARTAALHCTVADLRTG